MTDRTIEFGTLHPDGSVTDVVLIPQALITSCPFVILDHRHYVVETGECRCEDETHTLMRQWGYHWNAEQGRWIG